MDNHTVRVVLAAFCRWQKGYFLSGQTGRDCSASPGQPLRRRSRGLGQKRRGNRLASPTDPWMNNYTVMKILPRTYWHIPFPTGSLPNFINSVTLKINQSYIIGAGCCRVVRGTPFPYRQVLADKEAAYFVFDCNHYSGGNNGKVYL